MANMEDGAALDVVMLLRLLVLSIFGDTRGEIKALCL